MELDERFKRAVSVVLSHEGGHVNDPDDPGGETKYGITKRSYPDLDVASLTYGQAAEIYQKDFWQRYGYWRIVNDEIAIKVLDLSVNVGPRAAHKLLQRAVNGALGQRVDEDGVLGELTIRAVNTHPVAEFLLNTLKLLAIRYYVDLNKPKYVLGWVKRAIS